jgi:hypothetical protein
MRVWTFIKLLAAVTVIGVIGFTGLLAYHVVVRPLGGVFEKVVPNPVTVVGAQSDEDFVKMVDAAEMPDIDPGEKAFQKALELIALGQLPEAREKLNTIVNIFPTSSSAPQARHIVGEMNLDEILSTSHLAGKQTHVVKRGDSYLAIAAKYRTTLDNILYINGMQELKNLLPGEELIVMPLEYRLLIDPARKTLSLWDEGRFICEYPIQHLAAGGRLANQSVAIQTKSGQLDGRAKPKPKPPPKPGAPVAKAKPPGAPSGTTGAKAEAPPAPAVEKSIQLTKVSLRISSYSKESEGSRGIFLRPADFEELYLLTRVGNVVEIRSSAN